MEELLPTEIKLSLRLETKQRIQRSRLNPAGYRTFEYDDAYGEVFGDNVISKTQELIFDATIEAIWRDHRHGC